jgi:ADP-L-glycero-D-manno-heptose 6-epimerase
MSNGATSEIMKSPTFLAPEDLFPWLDRNEDEVEAIVHLGAISSTVETDGDLVAATNIRFSFDWCGRCDRRLVEWEL